MGLSHGESSASSGTKLKAEARQMKRGCYGGCEKILLTPVEVRSNCPQHLFQAPFTQAGFRPGWLFLPVVMET